MTLLLLYCSLTIPYFIAFDQSDAFRYADIAVDSMFFFDIVFCFVTAYVKYDDELDYQLEINPRVLAKRYLRGWFALDVLGTIPFTEVMRDSVQRIGNCFVAPGTNNAEELLQIVILMR